MHRTRWLVTGLISAAMAMAGLNGAGFASEPAPSGAPAQGSAPIWPGQAIFQQNCAGCHNGNSPKAPPEYMLHGMSPTMILHTIDEGVMKPMAAGLTEQQRRQLVEYLTKTDLSTYKGPPPPKMCDAAHGRFDLTSPPPRVGWGYDNTRFVPAAIGGLTARDLPRLKLKWALAFPDATQARSQPVVAMGAIFVGSHDGTVFALDLATGCARWTARAGAEVRDAPVVESWPDGTMPAHRPRVFFGDIRGNVYALDAQTGQQLWKVRPEDHNAATITGTVAQWHGTIYVPISSLEVGTAEDPHYPCCTFRGSVVALDMATGRKQWQAYTVQQEPRVVGQTANGTQILAPSGAPVWGSPTVDDKRGALYFGSGENYASPADDNSDAVIAVDLVTGERRWSYQLSKHDAWNNSCMYQGHPNCPAERGLDQDLASSPMLVDVGQGRQVLLAGAKSGMLTALDPDRKGAFLWDLRVGRGSLQGGIHFGMSAQGTSIYVPIYDSKTTPQAGTYTDAGYPGMHMVDAATGKLVWRGAFFNGCGQRMPCEAGISAATTAIPGAVLSGAIDGWLRAYDRQTGKVIWETNTAGDFPAVNGAMAHGGSMSGPGPAVYQGHLITNSGYGFAFKLPGNALLVYSLDGK
ncbi:outer membrane protein assembly factor BamB family protein [Novosphingobium rosa]|uniref:outer membrane protein assembly factor BamB family protein n=1 Tax=Novosphingobium rosa TaxID=76978 RepID=UPI0009FBAA01|nr:PQQ-binding-like beta-propeller repeat protein [Novosphingobium rosa]